MITVNTSIWAFPILIGIGGLNAFLFVAAARIVLGQLPAIRGSQVFQGLQQCVDPVVLAVRCRIEQWWGKAVHPFVPWGVCILGALVVRNVLIQILLASNQ